MKTQLFLLLLALSVLSTQAQSLSIKGRVTDASQEAVIAANVSLWTIDSTFGDRSNLGCTRQVRPP
ncbi:serine/arginine repetitive matrix protein 1 [Bacteroides sp. 4_1_36]|uniref:serine/arginine repetitive matrix protein 1 n=1 Tax=Bacteroides sp. 4_1_36 TaxID=457393 RepID=UPI0001EFFF46|nr:serine/arginine repetitive matrix protein 1 [Bacteroides sp. 4_1_36]EFV26793.1 serine/arginine repetitive matrix protein 1 [Bacteroides sp. 4_1_36]